jgi:hypothetical protein
VREDDVDDVADVVLVLRLKRRDHLVVVASLKRTFTRKLHVVVPTTSYVTIRNHPNGESYDSMRCRPICLNRLLERTMFLL